MLNEYKEYKEYTIDLKPSVTPGDNFNKNTNIYGRILRESLTERYGLKRILTIIARRFIYHDIIDIHKKIDISVKNKYNQLNQAKTALGQWCSYNLVNTAISSEVVNKDKIGCYYGYMNDLLTIYEEKLSNKSTESNIKDSYITRYKGIETAMIEWKAYYDNTLNHDFYSTNDGVTNKFDNKIITLDIIIAEALNIGPLKNRVVNIPYESIKNLIPLFNSKYKEFIGGFIFTSAYYYSQLSDNSNEYQLFNNFDMANWLSNSKFYKQQKSFNKILSEKNMYGTELIQNVINKAIISNEIIKDYILEDVELLNILPTKENHFLISDDIKLEKVKLDLNKLYNGFYKQLHPPKKRKSKKK